MKKTIEIIDEIPHAFANNTSRNNIRLEPLNPNVEYHQNLTRIFVNLEEYAKSILYHPFPLLYLNK